MNLAACQTVSRKKSPQPILCLQWKQCARRKNLFPKLFPDWALPMAKEFVNRKWVRKLEYFSAAMLQALAKDPTGGTNLCGGITDTSAKGIRFYLDGQHVQYTWAQFVKACAGAGITPRTDAEESNRRAEKRRPRPVRKSTERSSVQTAQARQTESATM